MPIAYIALGSNLGDRRAQISMAIKELTDVGVAVISVSSFLETEPYGIIDQPKFINAVMAVRTDLEVHVLLKLLLEIEQKMGRVRVRHWGERSIDLDILFYDNLIIKDAQLTLPHPDMQNRDFVLLPLVEIAPNFIHPVLGVTMRELLSNLKNGAEKK